jgi:hydrogenase expression/formation protein HypC
MCLAIPARIESIDKDTATVAVGGTSTRANVALVPAAKPGDWVLVHAGYAITILDEAEARETYALLKEMGAVLDTPPQGPQ